MRAGIDSAAGAGAAKGMPDSGGQNVAKRHTYPPASWDLPLSAKEMSGSRSHYFGLFPFSI